MGKTPAKKTAKGAKIASSADKKGKKKASRSESYSSYLYKVRSLSPVVVRTDWPFGHVPFG